MAGITGISGRLLVHTVIRSKMKEVQKRRYLQNLTKFGEILYEYFGFNVKVYLINVDRVGLLALAFPFLGSLLRGGLGSLDGLSRSFWGHVEG